MIPGDFVLSQSEDAKSRWQPKSDWLAVSSVVYVKVAEETPFLGQEVRDGQRWDGLGVFRKFMARSSNPVKKSGFR